MKYNTNNNSYYKIIIILFIASLLFYAVFVSYNYSNVEKFNDNTTKVLLFHATWCGHCKKYEQSGVFDKTSKNSPNNVQFIKYDYDTNTELAGKYNIQAFPTIISVDGTGQIIDTFKGDIYDQNALIAFATESAQKSS